MCLIFMANFVRRVKMRYNRLFKTTGIYLIGNFASRFLSIFLLPLYTIYLSPEDFGIVDIIISIVPLIGPVFTLQITDSMFRLMFDYKTYRDRGICISSSLFILFCGGLSFALFYFPLSFYYNFRYHISFFIYFICHYLLIFVQKISRGLSHNVDYAVSGVISSFVHIGFNALLIVSLGLGARGMIIAATISFVTTTVFLFIRINLAQYIRVRWIDINEIIRQIKYSLPLIPNVICWWVLNVIGKYILLFFHGEFITGILAVATKLPNFFTSISSVFMLAWEESAIMEYESELKSCAQYYSVSFSHFISFILAILSILLPITRIYCTYLIGHRYQAAIQYIPLFYYAAGLNSVAALFGSIYTASKKTKGAFVTTFISSLVCLSAGFIFVPYLRILGVGLANILALTILSTIRFFSVKKIIPININWGENVCPLLLCLLASLLYYVESMPVQVMMILTSVITIYNRFQTSQWTKVQKMIKDKIRS